MYRPLADEIRPTRLSELVGQEHILGEGAMLRRIIDSGNIPNMVFYGPSGTGKTTVAALIANETSRTLHRLNATVASLSDVRRVIEDVDTLMAPNGILLYLDEIQYFNKKQQQSLLEYIETGKITLIASTTDNPYFCVYNALLSRSTIFEFKTVAPNDALRAVKRAVEIMCGRLNCRAEPEDGVLEYISESCGGDVRKAVNAVELLFSASLPSGGVTALTLEDAKAVSQRSAMRYDRDGDSHYDVLSALQKSIRGSDPDAAVHYLARLLEAGDLLSACRRILVTASEDIGLAYPLAVTIVKSCVDSALQLGLPEARIPLSQAVILLASSPKSNSAINAYANAAADLTAGKSGDIPAHLMDSHYSGAKKLGRGLTYQYPHAFPGNYVEQQYLPDELKDRRYYEPGENKTETTWKNYWQGKRGK